MPTEQAPTVFVSDLAKSGRTLDEHPARVSGRAYRLSLADFLSLFDESVRDVIRDKAENYSGADGLVCYENLAMDSSSLGDRTAVVYGPGCTAKTLAEACDRHLGSVPSVFQYPVAYFSRGA